MKNNDIITLDDNKRYAICKSCIYDDREFLLLIEVDEDENLLNKGLIVEKINDGKNIKIVDDDILRYLISQKFAEIIINDFKN